MHRPKLRSSPQLGQLTVHLAIGVYGYGTGTGNRVSLISELARTRARTVTNRRNLHSIQAFYAHRVAPSDGNLSTRSRNGGTGECSHCTLNINKIIVGPTYLRLKYRSEMLYFAHTYHNAHMKNACTVKPLIVNTPD